MLGDDIQAIYVSYAANKLQLLYYIYYYYLRICKFILLSQGASWMSLQRFSFIEFNTYWQYVFSKPNIDQDVINVQLKYNTIMAIS